MLLGIDLRQAFIHPVQFVKDLIKLPFGRYLVIGVSVYLFELAIIVVAQWLGAGDLLAVALSFWLGLVTSFILTKFVTFGDKRIHHKILIPQIIAVSVLVLFNFGFTLLLTDVLATLVHPAISRTIALAITTFWNFYLYKTRIFKTEDPLID